MVKEVNAETLKVVLESWESLKLQKDYERVAGTMLFVRLFQKCPKAKPMFGYDIEADLDSAELVESAKFLAHAVYLIEMFNTALHMLGPDGSLLTTSLKELGNKHIKYGVQPEMFPIMGQALFFTLENQLGDAFTADVEQSWKIVYGALSQDMMRTIMGTHKQ